MFPLDHRMGFQWNNPHRPLSNQALVNPHRPLVKHQHRLARTLPNRQPKVSQHLPNRCNQRSQRTLLSLKRQQCPILVDPLMAHEADPGVEGPPGVDHPGKEPSRARGALETDVGEVEEEEEEVVEGTVQVVDDAVE